jgi:hypothetical protein
MTEQSGNWVAIVTGITSIVATIIAIGTFLYTWHKDSEEINVAQANKISAWIDNDERGEAKLTKDMKFMNVIINNVSEQPVYNVVLSSGTYQGSGTPYLTGADATSSIGTLPPGKYTTRVPYPGAGMHTRMEAAVSFTDTRGNSWIRDATGHLKSAIDPDSELRVDLPPNNWQALRSIQ